MSARSAAAPGIPSSAPGPPSASTARKSLEASASAQALAQLATHSTAATRAPYSRRASAMSLSVTASHRSVSHRTTPATLAAAVCAADAPAGSAKPPCVAAELNATAASRTRAASSQAALAAADDAAAISPENSASETPPLSETKSPTMGSKLAWVRTVSGDAMNPGANRPGFESTLAKPRMTGTADRLTASASHARRSSGAPAVATPIAAASVDASDAHSLASSGDRGGV
mmetsp:Transcript_11398/g.51608  ORF Transcript_11398/g.51608 Transcript_11398/m.51608 type:complete len:231 (-) Transcript_11398:1606-2298(-)